jgi:hypothetical protein
MMIFRPDYYDNCKAKQLAYCPTSKDRQNGTYVFLDTGFTQAWVRRLITLLHLDIKKVYKLRNALPLHNRV